ncbi:ATP-binding protein [Clostridium malenominatum]|uniref:histidine kinase n=1 Tax=Clostridium malenominatum TaxID=1539 RepID=A0ABN1IYY7_9CLOT
MKKKLFSTYLILILVGILTTGFLSLTLVHNFYEKKIIDNLTIKSDLINQSILLKHEKKENIIFHKLSQNYAKELNVRVTFLDEYGEVLADSYNNSIIFSNKYTRPEVIQAISGEVGSKKRYSNEINKQMLYVAAPMFQFGRRKIITRVAMGLDEVNDIYKIISMSILFSIVISIAIASFIGFSYTNSITEPIKQLTLATSAIAFGHFGKKVKVSTGDEIEELANNFNFMSCKVKDMVEEVENNNLKMHSILKSMSEGVLAIDKDFNIMLMNPLGKRMFNLKDKEVLGLQLNRVIFNNNIIKIVRDTFSRGKSEKCEVVIYNEKPTTLRILSSLIKEEDNSTPIGVVLLMEDITELKKLENLRKDFVSNVSHELKTPLTIINGFVETLRMDDVENLDTNNRFLGIIDSETKRLIKLVDELLLISRIEHKDEINEDEEYKLKEFVNISSMISEIYFMFGDMIKSKNINWNTNIEKDVIMYVKDKTLLKQMMINLIDNSIKYNVQGGSIQINAFEKYHNIIISIKDSGKGIPSMDIPRIFERFYRVEKGRGRKEGGTGLGLSLVKHIVISFGGDIKVKSVLGKGSEFIIKLPQNAI